MLRVGVNFWEGHRFVSAAAGTFWKTKKLLSRIQNPGVFNQTLPEIKLTWNLKLAPPGGKGHTSLQSILGFLVSFQWCESSKYFKKKTDKIIRSKENHSPKQKQESKTPKDLKLKFLNLLVCWVLSSSHGGFFSLFMGWASSKYITSTTWKMSTHWFEINKRHIQLSHGSKFLHPRNLRATRPSWPETSGSKLNCLMIDERT